MAYKVLMSGLDRIFKIDNYLIFDVNIDCELLCQEYKTNSLISFCNTGKFLDQL